jgi:hypothetical protein
VAPFAANVLAMADPIPDAPPVTIATLPSKLNERPGSACMDASCGGAAVPVSRAPRTSAQPNKEAYFHDHEGFYTKNRSKPFAIMDVPS